MRRRGGWVRDGPKRMEFSKLILVGVSVLALAVTVYACALMWRTGDTSGLSYLIPAAFAELATATGVYFSKAKRENEIKLKRLYGQLAEESEENANGY